MITEQELHEQGARLEAGLEGIQRLLRDLHVAGELDRFHFSETQKLWVDDKGCDALSYGIYNPNNFEVIVGAGGSSPTALGGGFVVPKQKVVIAPLEVLGMIEVAVPTPGEAGGWVWRFRFPTPQAFFVGALA